MKTLFLSIAALLCASFVGAQSIDTGSLSDYDLNKPFGFGAGITGGDGGSTVNVSTLAELKSALSGTTAKIIYVDGTITFTGQVKISDVENKTIIGLDGATFAFLLLRVHAKKRE
jgi:pectate lyase